MNRFAVNQEFNQFEDINKRLKEKEQNDSKAEKSLQFQEAALHLQYDDKSNFSAVARCGNDSRHGMLSEATLRLQIDAARESVEAACLTMPINKAMSSVALSNLVLTLDIEVQFSQFYMLGILLYDLMCRTLTAQPHTELEQLEQLCAMCPLNLRKFSGFGSGVLSWHWNIFEYHNLPSFPELPKIWRS